METKTEKETKNYTRRGQGGNCLIVTGGAINYDFAMEVLQARNYDIIIGADKGVEFFYKAGITPNHIVGDFDSLPREVFEKFSDDPYVTVRMFNPIKDATDTELAIKLALELDAASIWILGANGKRMDHMLANIQSLCIPLEQGVPCVLVDEYNEIRVINGTCVIAKDEMFGKYVSVFPLGPNVKDFTMEGFKYPVQNGVLTSSDSRSVSNEVVDEFGKIIFRGGRVVLILSRDKFE